MGRGGVRVVLGGIDRHFDDRGHVERARFLHRSAELVERRNRTLATMLIYRDENDRASTHRTLADVVAGTLPDNGQGRQGSIAQDTEHRK
jgi:hypothetical protein